MDRQPRTEQRDGHERRETKKRAHRLAAVELDDKPGCEFRLPGDIEMKRDETTAAAAGDSRTGRVEERREYATFQAKADVRHGEQLDAAACAGGETDLVVAACAVARESKQPREERPR